MLREYRNLLLNLLMDLNNPDYKNFLKNIYSQNSMVSFTWIGAKVVDFNSRELYIFKVYSQIFHWTSHIYPLIGKVSQFCSILYHWSIQATEIRVSHPANEQCISHILDHIDCFLRLHNWLANTYCEMFRLD